MRGQEKCISKIQVKKIKKHVFGYDVFEQNVPFSQLAKDDDHNALHMLAAQLAIFAVEDIGQRWITCRKNPTAANKLAVKQTAKKYFVHPGNTNWMDVYVKQWAKNNPKSIKSAK